MTTLVSRSATATSDPTALESLWKDVVAHLRKRKQALAEEIRSYPTPITRCDAQFNHLYEQQARLARELDRVAAAENAGCARRVETIAQFIASAPYSDEIAEREFRARVKTEFSALQE